MEHQTKPRRKTKGVVRIFFELRNEDAALFNRCLESYREVDASVAQVAKGLLKTGLDQWAKGAK